MFPSAIYDPKTKSFEALLGDCGIHDCKNAFCSGASGDTSCPAARWVLHPGRRAGRWGANPLERVLRRQRQSAAMVLAPPCRADALTALCYAVPPSMWKCAGT